MFVNLLGPRDPVLRGEEQVELCEREDGGGLAHRHLVELRRRQRRQALLEADDAVNL